MFLQTGHVIFVIPKFKIEVPEGYILESVDPKLLKQKTKKAFNNPISYENICPFVPPTTSVVLHSEVSKTTKQKKFESSKERRDFAAASCDIFDTIFHKHCFNEPSSLSS